jgi:hypothetical protein
VGLTTHSTIKEPPCYEVSHRTSDLGRYFYNISEQSAKDSIWTQERGSRTLEKKYIIMSFVISTLHIILME